jgi:crotonobetainyl-CoA:carnitine CoA-transferase CaiB-like acyl-CoA transferase
MRRYRGNDLVGVAGSGLMFLNGQPEDPPNQPGAEQAYHMASLAAASALLVALHGRDQRPGKRGHRIDISVQEAASMSTLQTANANFYHWFRRVPQRRGMSTFGGRHLYQCRDGQWISFVIMPYRWAELMRWFEEEGIDSDVKGAEWLDPAYRAARPGAAAPAIQALASKYTREQIFHEGQRRLISVMPVNDVEDLLDDAQLQERGFFVEFERDGRRLIDAGPVARMSGTPLRMERAAPRLGEHNEEVYQGLLGMSAAEVDRLRGIGLI